MRFIDWTKIKSCTFEEQRNLIPYINQLFELKGEFEKKGIYGFDEFLNTNADDFEKVSLRLVIQGYMPETCETIFFRILNSSNFENSQYLKYAIFAEFLLLIQKNEIGNQELKIRLLAYLGIECFEI